MAYQIAYDYQDIKKEKIKKISPASYILAVLGVVICLLCAQFGGSIFDILLMGEGGNAGRAAGEMLDSIRNGESVENAIEVFCRELSE